MATDSDQPFYIKSAFILLSAAIFILLLYIGEEIIIPLIFALFSAILLNPVVNFLVRKKIPRLISIFMSLLLAFIVAGAFLFFISMQVSMFAKTYPQLKEKYLNSSDQAIEWTAEKLNADSAKISGWVSKTESQFANGLSGNMGHTLLTVGSALVAAVLIPVYVFLILYYKLLLLEFVRKLFDPAHHQAVVDVLESVKAIIQSYLIGLLIEGAIVATLNSAGLFILGIEGAILLGVTGAILNVIPYIGGIAAIALPMIIAFVTKSWISALLVLAIYTVIQFIDNHYLIPYIVASKVKVNALIAIIAVLMGDMLWGVPGMFLSIPLVALIKVVFDHIEPLKPWGFLLGDNVPPFIKLPFHKKQK